VVVVEDPADTQVVPRLSAELAGLGLDVQKVAKKDDEQLPLDLVQVARAAGAAVAFRVVVSGDRAEVWIADQEAGSKALEENLRQGTQADGRFVALRAVELMRARLIKLEMARSEPAPVVPTVAPAPPAPPSRQQHRLSVLADSVFLWSPGGTSPAVGASAALIWRPTWLGLRLEGGSMLKSASLSRQEGRGDVTTSWIGAQAVAESRSSQTWKPRVGLGVTALFHHLQGTAKASWVSKDERVSSLSPTVAAGLSLALFRRTRLDVQASFMRPLHGVDIVVAGEPVAPYGVTIVLAQVGLEIELW
jgi:hypothetical protein